MGWFLAFAFLFFLYRLAKRARDRVAESAPTGILHSPLFHARTALLFALLGRTDVCPGLPSARALDHGDLLYGAGDRRHGLVAGAPLPEVALSDLETCVRAASLSARQAS